MNRLGSIVIMVALTAVALGAGCTTAPRSQSDRQMLIDRADLRVRQYPKIDPTIANFFESSYGYAVFPSVGSGAFVVGGGFGRGVVYEQGRAVGFASITSGSIGIQAGGQGFSQIIFFQTRDVLRSLKAGRFSFAADATAVAIDSGAAAQTTFRNGVAVFIESQSGLMAGASVGGQQFSYEPF